MAAVSVFVDDAIRGRLPLVCAKTGEPADLVIRIRHPVGGGAASMAWLLLFLGPPGWAAFLLVSILGARPEYLTVRIPETDASYKRERRLEGSRIAVFGMGVALMLYGIIFGGMFPALWLASGAACLVAAAVLHFKVTQQSIGISLDASRRWVTLSGVIRTSSTPCSSRRPRHRSLLTTPREFGRCRTLGMRGAGSGTRNGGGATGAAPVSYETLEIRRPGCRAAGAGRSRMSPGWPAAARP